MTDLQISAAFNNWQILYAYLKINGTILCLDYNLCKLLFWCIFWIPDHWMILLLFKKHHQQNKYFDPISQDPK